MSDSSITYTFSGLVHPERADVNIVLPEQIITSLDGSFSGRVALNIQRSQIGVVVRMDNPVEDIKTLKNGVRDFVKSAVDLLGYFMGCGYDVEIIQVVDDKTLRQTVFGVDVPILSAYREKLNESGENKFLEFFQMAATAEGMFLRRAINDLSSAIKSPVDTGFYCYRAIETIKQYFATTIDSKSDNAIWSEMRSDLDIERSRIDFIKEFADATRHGDYRDLSEPKLNPTSDDRDEMFKIAWDIVFRFMEHITI